jgi:putrescine transport system substrate-binding protein
LAKCGIGTLDSPAPFVRVALKYQGRDPNLPTEHDLTDVEKMLGIVRPYFRMIDSSNTIESLANGDICIAFDSNGDAVQARNRANDAKNGE